MDKCNSQTLNHEAINILNRPIVMTEIESVIKALPINLSPRNDDYTVEFYQIFCKKSCPNSPQAFPNSRKADNPFKLFL